MALIFGGIAAIVALLAGIMAKLDSSTVLERAGIAFVLGWVAGILWQVLSTLGVRMDSSIDANNTKDVS